MARRKLRPSEQLIREFAKSGKIGIQVEDYTARTMRKAVKDLPVGLKHIGLKVRHPIGEPTQVFLINNREFKRTKRMDRMKNDG